MRVTTLLRRLLGVTRLCVEQVRMSTIGAVERVCTAVVAAGHAAVRAAAGSRATTGSRLGCGVICTWGRVTVWLQYASRGGYRCGHCGVRVEQVSWAAHGSTFTAQFEEMAAYLAQVTERPNRDSSGGDFLAGGWRHRRAGGGSPSGRDAAGPAATIRGRRVQLSEASRLSVGGGRPLYRPAMWSGPGAQGREAGAILRPVGTGRLCSGSNW